jgi:hypothetical protein
MKLKPCPFCRSKRTTVVSHGEFQTVNCLGCFACGSQAETEKEAINLWNKRERKEKTMAGLAKIACEVIQLRVRLEETDENGNGYCCSCGVALDWQHCQGGHCEPKATYNDAATDRRNIHLQCSNCNKVGKTTGYTLFMIKKYGAGIIEEIFLLSKKRTHERNYYNAFIKAGREINRTLAKTKNFEVSFK